MSTENETPAPPEAAPETPEETPPSPPAPAAAAEIPAPPPAAVEVIKGRETEQTAELARKLEAQEKALKEREARLAAKEDELSRRAEPKPIKQKRAWLAGNSLVD